MTIWRVVGCEPANIRIWNDEAVVFSLHSGATHVLSAVAGEVLFALLDGGAASSSTLCERLASRNQVSNDTELADVVERLLCEMDELGLIASVAS